MLHNIYTKCIFASPTHVIFDFTVYGETLHSIIAEGNIVINNSVCNTEYRTFGISKDDIPSVIEEAISKCQERTKFILERNIGITPQN